MFPHHSYTTANAESDYERDSERESDGEDEVSCETVKMGRKDSLDLEVEVALGPEPEALEAGGSPSQEDVLPLLQQADELHQGSEQGKREGFQLLLNNKLAVRLVYLPCPCSRPRMSMTLPGDTGREMRVTWRVSASTLRVVHPFPGRPSAAPQGLCTPCPSASSPTTPG